MITMKFITEFRIAEEARQYVEYLVLHEKAHRQRDMGEMLARSFGWQNPINEDSLRYRLEIEAFHFDQWMDFRRRLIAELPEYDAAAKIRIMNALSDLEKPVKNTLK